MIELQIYIDAHPGALLAVRNWFNNAYLPALRLQSGFRSATLLRTYSATARHEIAAAKPAAPFLLAIRFDSEPERAAWQASSDHERVWPPLLAIADFHHHTAWMRLDEGAQ